MQAQEALPYMTNGMVTFAILACKNAVLCKNCRQIKSEGKYWFTAKNPAQNLK